MSSRGQGFCTMTSACPSHILTVKHDHQLFELEPRTPEFIIQNEYQNSFIHILHFVFFCLDIFVHSDVDYD